jgi:bifunctional non-homologous end joining protein LigD
VPNKLSAYHAKRDFRITREPKGRVQAGHHTLQFVVQEHHASTLRYDFRLELDGVLKSWAVPKGPSLDPGDKRLAVAVEDHPLAYASFEGTIPEHQYGAGTVRIWDSGYWEPVGDPAAGYRAGKLKFRLHGDKLQGGWTLVKTRLRGGSDKPQWLLIKERDDAAQVIMDGKADSQGAAGAASPAKRARMPARTSGTQSQQKKTARKSAARKTAPTVEASDLPAAVRAPMPASMDAQLATLVEQAPSEGDWIYEIKYDGYRILARLESGKVQLTTRDGKDWTAKLPGLSKALRALEPENAWLDGEIVVLDERGIPSFQQLQNAFDEKSTAKVIFFVFDLLYLNGYDLRNVPLRERRQLLEQVLAKADQEHVRASVVLQEPAVKLLDSACALDMEGIIGKLSASVYTGKRSADWIKLKCRKRQEFVIAGFTDPQGKRQFFGSLLLAVYADDGTLNYVGRVGTGFDTAVLQSVYKKFKPLMQARCPFPRVPKGPGVAKAHWLKPRLVAEISFAEWTKDGLLRQAVFHGLRTDKPAEQIRREQALDLNTAKAQDFPLHRTSSPAQAPETGTNAFHGIVITHPERVIDPASGLTKLDVARYVDAIAPHILPYLKNRPVYLLRSPGGLKGKAFFQRHAGRSAIPGVRSLDPAVDPEHQPLMVIATEQALIGAAQMGALELHACNATADKFERPDCMVFDLDPDPALPWKAIAEGARLTKQLLDELGLTSFVKTSGSKGLHVVVPLMRRHDWETVTQFSKAVALHLANTIPSRFSATMGEENRVGKIYIDYLRNAKMASTVAPYSTRARSHLPVSVPIAWEELDAISASAMWTIRSLPQRLAQQQHDPWREYFATRQMLTKRMIAAMGIVEDGSFD